MSSLRIRFDPAFDGPAWPGPLREANTDALFGSAWMGELALLDLLETMLGLGGLRPSKLERAAAMVPRLRELEGFWSASAQADALGTSARLIEQRDQLWLHGWRGQPVSSRLEQLARATADVAPALPDRLAAVSEALAPGNAARRNLALELTSIEPFDALMPAWAELFERLAARGARVEHRPLASAGARGDLAGARGVGFRPTGDGTLRLARAQGPLAAAEDVAAWIAALPERERERLLVIGADAVLDRALDSFGLPTTGGSRADPSLLRVVPLVLELAWQPADPALAYQLLVLPRKPLAQRLARRLVGALQRWPAVDSDAWREARDEGLAATEDEAYRQRQRDDLATIFAGVVPRGAAYPADEIDRRLALVERWAEHERERSEAQLAYDYLGVCEQCRSVRRIIALTGTRSLSAPDLRRLLSWVRDEVDTAPAFQARAGLAHVSRPEAIAGPARYCVWWRFDRDSAPRPRELGLSAKERQALAATGLRLPQPGTEAIRIARRWRRPLEQTTDALLLVCPLRSDDGEEAFPHPLWDEIEASIPADGLDAERARLLGPRPLAVAAPARRPVAPLPLPQPALVLHVAPERIGRRDPESPSGLAKLLGCPARWVFYYFGKLRAGLGAPPPGVSALTCGNLAHRTFAHLFGLDGALSPDEAARAAEQHFDREAPRLVAPLFLPGNENDCGSTRQFIASAARELFAQLASSRARVRSSERLYERKALGTNFSGTPDLVLDDPPAVVDFKWGGRTKRRAALRDGTALQLAAYAMLVARDGAPMSPFAYLIVRDHALLTTSGTAFPDGIEVADAPTPETIWRAARAAHDARRAELDGGEVLAPGAGGDKSPRDMLDEDGVLRVGPLCEYCDYGLLCGRALAGDA